MIRAPFLETTDTAAQLATRCIAARKGIFLPAVEAVALSIAVYVALLFIKFTPIAFPPISAAASIFREIKKGDWTAQTACFPTVEHTGEVSSYGDCSENGSAGANANWPQRQSYLFQTIVEYGELELDRAGLAKIGWVSEQNGAAALALNKYSNLTYFFGVQGLQNYGLLNDPNLTASLTPAPKAAGGNAWVVNGVIVATANEIYNDILSLFLQLTSQTVGLIDKKSPMKLCMSPDSAGAIRWR
jgi:hypothetical protein